MNRKILLGSAFIFVSYVFAVDYNQLVSQVNDYYQNGVKLGTEVYNTYVAKAEDLESNLSTGDYKILSYFTGIDISPVLQQIKDKYSDYINSITSKKFDLLSKLANVNVQFENGLLSTGDYETALNNLAVDVSGYNLTIKNELNSLQQAYSGLCNQFKENLSKKLQIYLGDISKYKSYELKLNKLNEAYSGLKNEYKKLENIIGVAKDVIQQKRQQLMEFLNKYYSDLLDKEFEKYLQQEPNMVYFQSGFQLKKQVLIGFVDNQIDRAFNELIKKYYPDIDLEDLSDQIQTANSKNPTEIAKNYDTLILWLESLNNTVNSSYKKAVDEKLSKFESSDKESILKVIENDLVNIMDNSTQVIQKDISQTLEGWKAFIETRKNIEAPLMKLITDEYSKALQKNTIESLENFLNILKSYDTAIILPENKKILSNYEKVVKNTLQGLKFKQLQEEINSLAIKLNNLSYGDFSGLNQLKEQIKQLYNQAKQLNAPKDLIQNIKKLELQVKLKENLNKLYKSGAIVFYYKYGDLSDEVAKILEQYYEKYKKEGKEQIFMEKINNAFKKLELLEQSLNNDLRSYYIIMIYNGLLKFQFNIDNK